jgi:hypothetical protein
LIFVCAWISGALIGFAATSSNMKQQIIDRGYGQYCMSTGEFSWLNECNE